MEPRRSSWLVDWWRKRGRRAGATPIEDDKPAEDERYRLEQERDLRWTSVRVYDAVDVASERPVVLWKIRVQREGVEDWATRQEHALEARHPALVSVLDLTWRNSIASGEYGGPAPVADVTVVLERVDLPTLSDLLAQRDMPPSAARARAVITQLAEALAVVHGQGLVHGAVDPRHIRVSVVDDRLEARLDGLVVQSALGRRWADGPQTGLPLTWPTPGALLPATDVYGLACLTHLLVTGRAPIGRWAEHAWRESEGQSVIDLLFDPPSIKIDHPSVPPGLAEVIEQALEPAPARRPSLQDYAAAALANLPA